MKIKYTSVNSLYNSKTGIVLKHGDTFTVKRVITCANHFRVFFFKEHGSLSNCPRITNDNGILPVFITEEGIDVFKNECEVIEE